MIQNADRLRNRKRLGTLIETNDFGRFASRTRPRFFFDDEARAAIAIKGVVGKRLTYKLPNPRA